MNRRTLTRSFLVATATGVALPGALRAQTPSASPVSSGDIRLAEIEGIALGLSPDGTMIAGVGKEDRFLVWDAETYETVARSEPMPEISIIDHTSVAWSPDSTALAWSLDAARLMLDSDIYVFDIDSGQITNLTDDEPTDQDAVSLMDDKVSGLALDVDLYPSWSADGESLYFARSTWEDVPEIATSLWRIPRDGGDATEIAVLAPDAPLLVSSIYAGMEDGSVLYATWPVDSDGPHHGIFLVTPDGEVEGISTGMLARTTLNMVLISVAPSARKASVVSTANYARLMGSSWIEIDLDTGVPTPFEEVLGLPIPQEDAGDEGLALAGAPAFLTDEAGALTGYLYFTADRGFDNFTLWRQDTEGGEGQALGSFDNAERRGSRHIPRIEIADNGMAGIFFGGNVWLTTIPGR